MTPASFHGVVSALALSAMLFSPASTADAQNAVTNSTDPRVGLKAGWKDAGVAARHLELVGHRDKPAGFFNKDSVHTAGYSNTDLAFKGNTLVQGNYAGFMIWDITTPTAPVLRTSVVCPGNQGDPSVYGNLLFISIQATSARLDCGGQGIADTVSTKRFRGVRIYDITNPAKPRTVASVQTCRGSHTHTLVTDPKDDKNVYVYVSGTSVVRSGRELAGCSARPPEEDPNTSLFRIEVIKVPLAAPQDARIVNTPRLFADSSGAIAGLWKGGTHGEGTQETRQTSQCHDITVYPAIGLGAGACSGNGILIDIRDPANPKRITEVSDPNFAYWHSATFNNDGTKVLFTDEWGGGSAPRCRATDRAEWGADAIYTLANNKLTPASFFKLPAAQTATENCVAHNGSLIPVPGRDIFVQSWYQGGISVIDFTDAVNPKEIAFFDRGPVLANRLVSGGHWSAYWYNGYIYGSEISRGLDILELKASEFLSQHEIDAAKLVKLDLFNAQLQPKLEWPASFVVARAYVDQLVRNDGQRKNWSAPVSKALDDAERLGGASRITALTTLAVQLEQNATGADSAKVRALAGVVRSIGGSQRTQ